MYPWPSFGSFLFTRDEHYLYGTDTSWVKTPNYSRQRPLGTNRDVITTLSIGSAERSWEMNLSPERFSALESLMNSANLLTDWNNPPDSRQAFLSEVAIVEEFAGSVPTGIAHRKVRARVTFVEA